MCMPKNKKVRRAILANSMVAHKDQCVVCKRVYDNEELHSIQATDSDKFYPMCEPCIEEQAIKQESQDHDLEAYRLPDDAYEFDPAKLG